MMKATDVVARAQDVLTVRRVFGAPIEERADGHTGGRSSQAVARGSERVRTGPTGRRGAAAPAAGTASRQDRQACS